MPKRFRGSVLNNLPARGRGTCPICGRTRIKLLYDREMPDGTRAKVCKNCRHPNKNQ